MATTRGRPKALTYEFCQDIWVRFEFLRMRPAKPDGRLASIRHVAMALAASGGVAEIVGGNREMLALELPLLAKTRLAHATVETIEARIPIPVYATYMTPEATRIRNLYYEARKWTADHEIHFLKLRWRRSTVRKQTPMTACVIGRDRYDDCLEQRSKTLVPK